MDLMSLVAKLTLDSSDYDRGIQHATEEADSMGGKLKSGFAKAGKMVAGAFAVGTVVNGIKQIVTESVNAYAEYEQLVGGVNTLFGEEAAKKVVGYAQQAYTSAGLSANEYMNTVTGFSASLIQSLEGDTEAAVEAANRAVTDMSDNANKMGTSMESIQFAYQGFAKQNYTMLDNLKLGYGGTKQEMERLISDAAKMTDVQEELNLTVKDGDLSFANIVNAISVVQSKMGIMGATAQEASTTISGSINSMKAAWTNFLTGLGDPEADVGELSDKLVESVLTVGANLLPVILRVVQGLLTAVAGAIADGLAALFAFLTEWLSNVGADLGAKVMAFGENIKATFAYIWESIKSVFADVAGWFGSMFTAAYNAITGAFGSIRDWFAQKFEDAKNAVINAWSNIQEEFKKIGSFILDGLWSGITSKVDWLKGKVTGVVDTVKSWFTGPKALNERSPSKWAKQVGRYVTEGLAIGITEKEPELVRAARQVFNALENAAQKTIDNVAGLRELYADEVASRTKSIYNSFGLFDEAKGEKSPSGSKLIHNLQSQVDMMTSFYENIAKLSERGIAPQEMIDEIRDMGFDAADELEALLKMSDTQLTKYAELYGEKQRIANDEAVFELQDLKDESEAAIRQNIDNLIDVFTKDTPEVAETFVSALAKGIKDGAATIADAATNAAKEALVTAQKAIDEAKKTAEEADAVALADSALGKTTAATINASSGTKRSTSSKEYTINLMTPDGKVMASWLFNPLADYAKANGTPIINPA